MKTLELEVRQPDTSTAQAPIAAIIASAHSTLHATQFEIEAAGAHEVYLAGSFNDWNPKRHPLKRHRHGLWQVTVRLSPGRHEYRFVVDGIWASDPKAVETAQNPFGSENSILVIKS